MTSVILGWDVRQWAAVKHRHAWYGNAAPTQDLRRSLEAERLSSAGRPLGGMKHPAALLRLRWNEWFGLVPTRRGMR